MNKEEIHKNMIEKYVGKPFENKYGETAVVISYINSNLIEIMFEDGYTRFVTSQQLSRRNYKKIKTPNKIESTLSNKGAMFENSKGEKVVVVEYYGCHNVEVEFEDGTRRSFSMQSLRKGSFLKNKKMSYEDERLEYIGMEFVNFKNEKCRVVDILEKSKAHVIFEDGEKGAFSIYNLKKRKFSKPSTSMRNKEAILNELMGKFYVAKTMEVYEVIEYINNINVKIRFLECGECCIVTLKNIRNNNVVHPSKIKNVSTYKKEFIGKIFKNNKDEEVIVIDYISSKKVIVRFLRDGAEKILTSTLLKLGVFCHPEDENTVENGKNKYVGKKYKNNNGETVVVKEYRNCEDILVEFQDGVIRKVSTTTLSSGSFSHPNTARLTKRERVLGCEYKNNYKLKAVCVKYNNAKDITLQFEDGTCCKTSVSGAESGKFSHPIYNSNYSKKEYVVYRFLDDNDNVLYVGKSVQYMVRLYQHLTTGSKTKADNWKSRIKRFQYINLENNKEMSGVESYLIYKYKPIGNLVCNSFKIYIDENCIEWKEYDLTHNKTYHRMLDALVDRGIDITKNY